MPQRLVWVNCRIILSVWYVRIVERMLLEHHSVWKRYSFVCKSLSIQNLVYCNECFKKVSGVICAECRRLIKGKERIHEMGHYYHPVYFPPVVCLCIRVTLFALTVSAEHYQTKTVSVNNEAILRAFCNKCARELASSSCPKCKRALGDSVKSSI